MTPEEFLHKLKNLPEDSLLTPAHIVGIVEIIKPLLKEKPAEIDYDKLSNSQLIDENTLAKWLCQSIHTIRKWREKGGVGPKFTKVSSGSVRYKVQHIREWLDDNVYTSTTDYDYRSRSFTDIFSDKKVYLNYDEEKLVDFFTSIDREDEPTSVEFFQYENCPFLDAVLSNSVSNDIDLNQEFKVCINSEIITTTLDKVLEYLELTSNYVEQLIDKGLEIEESSKYRGTYESIKLYKKLQKELSYKNNY